MSSSSRRLPHATMPESTRHGFHFRGYMLKNGVLCLLFLMSFGEASQISYQVDFTVSNIPAKGFDPVWQQAPSGSPGCFQFQPEAGQVFGGTLVLEDTILSTDGDRIGGLVSLNLDLAGVNWGYDALTGNSGSLWGFRSSSGIGAVSPSFMIKDGQLVGWEGGVFGSGDAPFIDFFDTKFASIDAGSSGQITGDTKFTRVESVPEPGGIFLLMIGLCGIVVITRKRKISILRIPV
jgi:hypothetical protein